MFVFQLGMLFAGCVWAIPEPGQMDGVGFKLTRVNKLGGGVNAVSKRQQPNNVQYTSPLGDLSDDCMSPIRSSDLVYTMDIQIGSQNKAFTVMLDTQTSGIWVASSNCTTGGCVGMSTLGFSDSATLAPSDIYFTWNMSYPENGTVSGGTFNDSVTVAGFLPTESIFGLADTIDSGFNGNVRPLAS